MRPGATGSLILSRAVATIDYHINAEHETGDHFLVIGEVVELVCTRAHP